MFRYLQLLVFGFLLALSYAQDQLVDSDLSIGVKQPISNDGWHIDGFEVLGVNQILRDRIILTPIHPGGQRAAIWSNHGNPYEQWTAEIEFRATGEDRSGGAFIFWYTSGGALEHGTNSVYTSGSWDGMAILVDKYGNYGGSLRSFLNDGRTDYSIHHNVNSLSFAHCDFKYRNLGAPSKVTINHTLQGLKVLTDGRTCFETKDVRLPTGYHFGISASSADQPDSFELFKMKISSPAKDQRQAKPSNQKVVTDTESHRYETNYKHGGGSQVVDHPDRYHGKLPHEVDFKEFKDMIDEEATKYKTTSEQFKDLHDRLQALTHHIAHVQDQIGGVYDKVEHAIHRLDDYNSQKSAVPKEQITRIEQRLAGIENSLRELEQTLHSKDYTTHFDSLHRALNAHSSIMYNVPHTVIQAIQNTTESKLKFLIGMLLVLQIGFAAGYVWYKKRRAQSPKKFI